MHERPFRNDCTRWMVTALTPSSSYLAIAGWAWNNGQFIDLRLPKFATEDLDVSSVPYFDDRCHDRFRIDQLEATFDEFCEKRGAFQTRAYVSESLSLEIAAARYIELYDRLR